MNNPENTISKKAPKDISMDYERLRQEGIEHLEKLATYIWTDFNAHDPGITILEVLCYAITDLGYRANLPIEDILTSSHGKKKSYFTATEVLPVCPVTEIDYRKVLIDFPGVRNAWLEKATIYILKNESTSNTSKKIISEDDYDKLSDSDKDNYLDLNGLYKICIDTHKSFEPNSKAARQFMDKIYKGYTDIDTGKRYTGLNDYRNLCEDFYSVQLVESVNICLCLDISIDSELVEEEVMAEVLFRLQEYITPSVSFYTFQQLLEEGLSCDEIFNGPFLNNGFIKKEELENATIPKKIIISDLYHIILDTSGVQKVNALKIRNPGEAYSNSWCFDYRKDQINDCPLKPVIDLICSNLTVHKSGVTNTVSHQDIVELIELKQLGIRNLASTSKNRPTLKPGMYREDLNEYKSIQFEFPRNYIIGNNSVPDNATHLRKAQIKQLQAYLLFFDQLLGGYLEQLSHVGDILSIDQEPDTPTYFYKTLYEVPGMRDLLKDELYVITEVNIKKLEGKLPQKLLAKLKLLIGKVFYGTVQFEKELDKLLDPVWKLKVNILKEAFIESKNPDIDPNKAIYEISTYGLNKVENIIPKSLYNKLKPIAYKRFTGITELLDEMDILLGEGWREYESEIENAFKQPFQSFDWDQYIDDPENHYIKTLQQIVESDNERFNRKNLILNHLLARFGERFTEYSLRIFQSKENHLKSKSEYLKYIDILHKNKAKAYNYRAIDERTGRPDVWAGSKLVGGVEKAMGSFNVSGLKNKFYHQLGWGQATTESVFFNPTYRLVEQEDKNRDLPYRFLNLYRLDEKGEPAELLLFCPKSYSPRSLNQMKPVLYVQINNIENYKVVSPEKEVHNNVSSLEQVEQYKVIFSTNIEINNREEIFELTTVAMSEREANIKYDQIKKLIDSKLKSGFHILEHILLRPNDEADKLLQLSSYDTHCETELPIDPYSYWITLVLPGWKGFFKDKEHKENLKQKFLMETPVHVAVCFRWVNTEDEMENFEHAFEQWREALANCNPDECEITTKANRLIELLNNMPCDSFCAEIRDPNIYCDDSPIDKQQNFKQKKYHARSS